jgi:hypothetical protein
MAARMSADAAQRADQIGHGRRWCADDGEIGRGGQVGHARVGRLAIERGLLRVDRPHRAGKTAGAQVAPDRGAHAARARGGADHGHGTWLQKVVEVANAHQ